MLDDKLRNEKKCSLLHAIFFNCYTYIFLYIKYNFIPYYIYYASISL